MQTDVISTDYVCTVYLRLLDKIACYATTGEGEIDQFGQKLLWLYVIFFSFSEQNYIFFSDKEPNSDSRPGMRGGHQMCIDVNSGLYLKPFRSVMLLLLSGLTCTSVVYLCLYLYLSVFITE